MKPDYCPENFTGEFSNNFSMEQICQDLFGDKTNRSIASKARQRELEELYECTPPVEILMIASQDRSSYDEFFVTVPEAIQERLENLSFPISEDIVAELEDLMMEYHQVEEPSWIMIYQDYRISGKLWKYVSELEKLRTPFIYMHPF